MAEIISRRNTVFTKVYHHEFRSRSKPYGWAGALFDCTEKGTLVYPQQEIELEKRKADPDQVYDGIVEREIKHTEPGVLECDCGEHVSLYGFTNTCECGADYNMSGSRLAPRSQWGEETGESASDILNHDYEGDFVE